MKKLSTLSTGQRVKVCKNADGIPLNALGTVTRVRTDGGAWVALDKRSKVSAVHPFAPEDPRGNNVLAYPDDCEPAQENRKQRRAAQKPGWPEFDVDDFGRDHWSTFGYLATRCIDHKGIPDKPHMRTNAKRHPLLDNGLDASGTPTRLKRGVLLEGHDDWDCADDLIEHGFLLNLGTPMNPQYRLTEKGADAWRVLSLHRQEGRSFETYEWMVKVDV